VSGCSLRLDRVNTSKRGMGSSLASRALDILIHNLAHKLRGLGSPRRPGGYNHWCFKNNYGATNARRYRGFADLGQVRNSYKKIGVGMLVTGEL